jgi:hypothetical protein
MILCLLLGLVVQGTPWWAGGWSDGDVAVWATLGVGVWLPRQPAQAAMVSGVACVRWQAAQHVEAAQLPCVSVTIASMPLTLTGVPVSAILPYA